MEIFKERNVPETVALVAMGASRENYFSEAMRAGGRFGIADETWVVNKLGSVMDHDIVFRMDDLRSPRQCNLGRGANKDPDCTVHDTQTDWMKTHNKPIITSTAYPEFPTSIEYPLEEVINTIGYSYFLTTPAYAAAFAIHIGVKHLKLYGCDYVYPGNIYQGEQGRANLEFILGIGMMKGVLIYIAPSSTLLGTHLDIQEHLYGYEHIIEVVESKQEGKRYELKHRHDETEKRNAKIKEHEKQQWQALTAKNIEEIRRDLIKGGWITQEHLDMYLKQEVSDEAENNNTSAAAA